MRIVHAIRSDGFAGVERHVARLATAQAGIGHEVLVIGGDPGSMQRTVDPAGVRHLAAVTMLDVAAHLRNWAPGAHVLHVHMTAAEVAATLAAASLLGTVAFPPVIATRHFASARGAGRIGRVTAAAARHRVVAQIAISQYVADNVDGSSTVVHPGVEDRPDTRPAAERRPVVLMVQRLEPEKNADVGIRAFAQSGLADRGWQLEIAGDGSLRADLEDQAERAGLGGAVRFLGARTDVLDLMTTAGLLLAPCAVEGLGLSVLEAMAAGLPVVAAAAGGHLETLTGLDPLALAPLPATGDPAEAAGAHLAALAADVGRRDDYGRRAQDSQRRRFTPHAQVTGTHAIYQEVL